jgi:arylsulfatase
MRRVSKANLIARFLASVMAVVAFAHNVAAADARKPNIVFILMDNLGYGEPGCYGGGIVRGAPMSWIDKLATEGTRLLNFNVEPQCTRRAGVSEQQCVAPLHPNPRYAS